MRHFLRHCLPFTSVTAFKRKYGLLTRAHGGTAIEESGGLGVVCVDMARARRVETAG
jgi:hypothetical protein